MRKAIGVSFISGVLLFVAAASAAGQATVSTGDWNGYEKSQFQIDGHDCYVVIPKVAAAGKPWLWRARFPEYHPEAAIALLSKGFYVAYMDLPNIFGSPEAVRDWNDFYDYVTGHFGLSRTMALEGVSRGGLFLYNWASSHPDKVNAIFCESPVCDMKSWPGGRGKGIGSPKDWQEALQSYGFTESQMLAFRGNPIDRLKPLAAAHIPILHVVCESDRVVPPAENTDVLAERYRKLGGQIEVHVNHSGPLTLNGHHFPLDDPAMEVNFVLKHTPGMERLAGTGMTPHGREYYQLRGGLRNSYVRLSKGGTARVVFLGGSITRMKGWRDLVCSDLKKRFPQTTIDCVDAGIPSLGSTPGAFRMTRDVFGHGHVALLFQEAAVNDESNGATPTEEIRGEEGIVRHAREIDPTLDIVLLHFVDPDMMKVIRSAGTPVVIQMHEKVADRYKLPSIDLAREVTERIDAGEFTWEKDFISLHPSRFGHYVYLRSIQRMLEAAWKGIPSDATIRPHEMPPPIDSHSYFRGRLGDVRKAVLGDGWHLDEHWQPADKAPTRPGFVDVPMLVANTPGATLRYRFEGTAVGIFVTSGPDAGEVEFSVDGAPFRRMDLYTRWSHSLHLPWARVLDGDLSAGNHELVLRVAADSNPASKGHAVRIASMLLN